jgi:hypothetical protein
LGPRVADTELTNDEQVFLDALGDAPLGLAKGPSPKVVKFNIAPIARSNRGITYSDLTKKRISEAMIGKNVGKSNPHSPEWKIAVSASMVGLVRSEETKAKISASLRAKARKVLTPL